MRNIREELLHSHTKFGFLPLSFRGSIVYSFNRPEKQREVLGDDFSSLLPKKTKQNETTKKPGLLYLWNLRAIDRARGMGVPLTGNLKLRPLGA